MYHIVVSDLDGTLLSPNIASRLMPAKPCNSWLHKAFTLFSPRAAIILMLGKCATSWVFRRI